MKNSFIATASAISFLAPQFVHANTYELTEIFSNDAIFSVKFTGTDFGTYVGNIADVVLTARDPITNDSWVSDPDLGIITNPTYGTGTRVGWDADVSNFEFSGALYSPLYGRSFKIIMLTHAYESSGFHLHDLYNAVVDPTNPGFGLREFGQGYPSLIGEAFSSSNTIKNGYQLTEASQLLSYKLIDLTTSPAPEPEAVGMALIGLCVLALMRKRPIQFQAS